MNHGQTSADGQSREDPLASDEDDGWTPARASKSKKTSQSRLQNTSNPTNVPRFAPGSSSASQHGSQSKANIGSTSSNTQNNQVDLCCNHFEVQFHKQPLPIIHQYKVKIDFRRYPSGTQDAKLSEVTSKGLKKKIFHALCEEKRELNRSAYDGGSDLFSTHILSSDILNRQNEVFLPRKVNPNWPPENRAEASRQPEDLVYEVTIQQSQANPREGSSFPNEHTRHGEPGPNDKIYLQALTIFLVDSSAKSDGNERRLCVRSNNNFYSKPLEKDAQKNVGQNVVVWEGFHSSFRLTYAAPDDQVPRLLLNYSDVMTAVLVSIPVEDFIKNLLPTNGRTNRRITDIDLTTALRNTDTRNMVNTALSGVRVETTCGKYLRNYTIRELTSIASIEHSFPVKKRKENGEIEDAIVNVRDHFLSQHKYTLRHPRWPLLSMKGGKNGPVYIPIEVCKILDGQRYMRISPEERSNLLNLGRISPGQKKTKIENSLKITAATYEANTEPLGESFGIQIQRSMINVTGQVLAPPTLHFRQSWIDLTKSDDPGQWNVKYQRMAKPVALKDDDWAVYAFFNDQSLSEDEVKGLVKDLSKMFSDMGMVSNTFKSRAPGQNYFLEKNGANENPSRRIKRMIDTVGSRNLIVVVLPSKSPELYVPLKKICETANGGRTVITQCVVMRGRRSSFTELPHPLPPQHLANLALKINLKMGGTNFNVDLENILGKRRTCIFGIDVSHGSTKDTDKPSIAAVVASVEKENIWSRYAPQVRQQNANQEKVENLQEMVVDLLKEYRTNHGQLPQQIIVYRDGISESQFATVGFDELEDFKKACNSLADPFKILITFIIVQKRHHTRFFKRMQNRGQNDTFENMKPGTVVTSQVCQTQNQDFYLCSHQSFIKDHFGNPGVTSRPTHYTILDDGIKFGQAKIQNLTNHLCYCFGRATKAVSIPAPVYHAHVAAKHYSYFMDTDDAEGREPRLRNINYELNNAPYRMFYI